MRRILVAILVIVISFDVLLLYLIFKKRSAENFSRQTQECPDVLDAKPEDEPGSEPEPREILPNFVEVPVFRQSSEKSIYGDIISHSHERPFGAGNGRGTSAHETAHGIHSYLRNQHGGRVNGFYCLEGRGVIVEEPGIRKRDIAQFIPQNLRSYRYNLYIAGQRAWDSQPLYIYDEWVAYTLGGMTHVDDVKNERHRGGWTDGVSGCLEFSIYSVALCMAVKQGDADYWENNHQFRTFTIFQLRQAQEAYLEGHRMDQFKWDKQDILLREFLTSESAKNMRKFIDKYLEGIWLDVTPEYLEAMSYEPHQTAMKPVERTSLILP